MRLTVYSDFSLRLLIYLAVSAEARVTIGTVADAYGIPKNHLTKVAHQLGLAGYVATVRGKGGGLRLAKPPASIRLGDVVRLTEPDFALVPCFAPVRAGCPIIPACGLIGALRKAGAAFLAELDRYTLADITVRRSELCQLLGLPTDEPNLALR